MSATMGRIGCIAAIVLNTILLLGCGGGDDPSCSPSATPIADAVLTERSAVICSTSSAHDDREHCHGCGLPPGGEQVQ